jgi:gamma-glutamylputrescine oxidase
MTKPEPTAHQGLGTLPVWDDGAGDVLPPLRGEVHAEICVIGLGGSGLSALAQLADAGVDAIGIDSGQVAAGAAGRNGGFLLAGVAEFHHDAVARFGHARALALYRLTLAEMQRWYADGVPGARCTGTLRIAADAQEWHDCEQQFAAMRSDGLPVEHYSGTEGRGLLFPRDGVFQPMQRWRDLATSLQARGMRLYGDSFVRAIAGTQVQCADACVHAKKILIAVDGGLEALLPELATRVRSARLQMLATAPTREVHLSRPVYFRDGYDYWQQDAAGRLMLGGGRDIGGEEEWGAPAEPTAIVQTHLEKTLRERLGLSAPITHRWAARVAFTDDGLPIFGEWRPGVFVTGAYNGTGNIFGALCGRSLANLALGATDALAECLRR